MRVPLPTRGQVTRRLRQIETPESLSPYRFITALMATAKVISLALLLSLYLSLSLSRYLCVYLHVYRWITIEARAPSVRRDLATMVSSFYQFTESYQSS